MAFEIAIILSKLVLVVLKEKVLMEKLAPRGFAATNIIYVITMNVTKLNCLDTSLEKKIC